MLASGRNFHSPFAPARNSGSVDLTIPLTQPGLGFIASVLLNPRRKVQYVTALNQPNRLLLGYCFRRSDFPWVAIWEENQSRANAPWNGRAQTRGLEFGSTPSPVTRREAFAVAPMFDTHFFHGSGQGKMTVNYVSFLTQVPEDFRGVRDVQVTQNDRRVNREGSKPTLRSRRSRHWSKVKCERP